jgi:hypothetical protein
MKKLLGFLCALMSLLMIFTSCQKNKDDVTFDESLLIGRWVSGTDYFKFNKDNTSFSWNSQLGFGKTFTWTLNQNSINIVETSSAVTNKYKLTQLTSTILVFTDNSGISYSYTKDTEIFDENLLIGKWVSGTKYFKFNSTLTGSTWNTNNSETESTGLKFTWSFAESDQGSLYIVESGETTVKEYIIAKMTTTTLEIIDNSGNFYSLTKGADDFDATLLIGKWQSGSLYYKYLSDYTGCVWDLNEGETEAGGQQFTWSLDGSNLTHIYITTSGNIPAYFTVTELTITTLKYRNAFGILFTYTKI